MDQPPPLPPEPFEEPRMTLASRMFNVFATPGEVFEQVRVSPPSAANWVVPALLATIVGWIAVALIYSQPAFKEQMREMTEQAIQKQVEKMHLPKEEQEKAIERGGKAAAVIQQAAAYAGPPMMAFLVPLIWGLILWLVGTKALHGNFAFMQGVGVAGLANMIAILDGVVRTLLILGTNHLFASPSLALMLTEFHPENPVHSLMAAINVMTLWALVVRAIGLARLSRASFLKSALWVFGLWAAYTAFAIAAAAASQAMAHK
jgi:hypothetical protein